MWDYYAYGLHIRSEMEMPELLSVGQHSGSNGLLGDPPDVVVHVGSVIPPRQEEMRQRYYSHADATGFYYFVSDVGGLLVQHGNSITVAPENGPGGDNIRHLVSGIGMGLVLHQRGKLGLHGSAVNIEDGVVAFIGWKGMGKSTTTAALHSRGYPVITDDLLVIDIKGENIMVQPAFPGLKLLPEAAIAALGDDPEQLPKLHPDGEKRERRVQDKFASETIPMRAIYVLDYCEPGESSSIEPLSAREAWVELTRHAFGLRILGSAGDTPEFLQLRALLAQRIPVKRFKRERRLEGLSEIVDMVEKDLGVYSPTEAAAGKE